MSSHSVRATSDEKGRRLAGDDLIATMKSTAAEHGRDGDAIPVYAMCMGKPGDALYGRVEGLAAVGVSQTIVATFRPDVLTDVGHDLTSRFS